MGEQKSLYAVVLTFSREIEKSFTRLGEDYQHYMRRTIVPHLTLVYPFVPVFSLFKVNEQLEAVAKRTTRFRVVLDGIKYFEGEHNVAYAALENKQPVKKLHTDIIKSLDGMIKEWHADGKYNLDRFIPHVTIAEKIPAGIFPNVKKRFSGYRLHHESSVNEFSLFSEKGGDWQTIKVFKLAEKNDGRTAKVTPSF